MARALEIEGIVTTLTSWHRKTIESVQPPRALVTRFKRGGTLGRPHEPEQQKQILLETLKLLAMDVI